MKTETIKNEVIGSSIFYINKKNGVYNFNRVNEKTNKTYHYKNEKEYKKAITRAKK